jgi:hypothetical protein
VGGHPDSQRVSLCIFSYIVVRHKKPNNMASAVPLFVSHLTRVSANPADVLNFRRNFHIVRHKHDRRRFRKRTVKQALEHLICYLGTVPLIDFPDITNFDSDSESDADISESDHEAEEGDDDASDRVDGAGMFL